MNGDDIFEKKIWTEDEKAKLVLAAQDWILPVYVRNHSEEVQRIAKEVSD